jgi:hypothetical protein
MACAPCVPHRIPLNLSRLSDERLACGLHDAAADHEALALPLGMAHSIDQGQLLLQLVWDTEVVPLLERDQEGILEV